MIPAYAVRRENANASNNNFSMHLPSLMYQYALRNAPIYSNYIVKKFYNPNQNREISPLTGFNILYIFRHYVKNYHPGVLTYLFYC
jgi:hypothetical protein